MQAQKLRVILAAEHAEARYFLKRMVEEKEGGVIVGQAENAVRAINLSRSLRPDVAIIDTYLPHTIGLDAVPLSRIGGLDVAQTISEEIPNVRVVLLNGHEDRIQTERYWGANNAVTFCQDTQKDCVPFTLHELRKNDLLPAALVFAHVEATRRAVSGRTIGDISDKAMLFGILGILAGWFLIITMALAVPGVYLTAASGAALFFGIVGKFVAKLRAKRKQESNPS